MLKTTLTPIVASEEDFGDPGFEGFDVQVEFAELKETSVWTSLKQRRLEQQSVLLLRLQH
jgi:hypothetical protein